MSHSEKKSYRSWTKEQIDEMYDDWLSTPESNIKVAQRYGFARGASFLQFLERHGKRTEGVKKAVCEFCGEVFVQDQPTARYCSDKCAEYASDKSVQAYTAAHRNEMQAERERRIKERFFGYSKIVSICIAAKAEGLSYGQYVGKYNL